MYNTGLKEEYIQRIGMNSSFDVGNLVILFEKTEEFEEQFHKDVCLFNHIQAQTFFDSFTTKNTDYLNSITDDLLDYTSWCKKQKLTSENIFTQFNFYYNSTRKNNYIEIEKNRGICKPSYFLERLFKLSSRHEHNLDKDLCDFSKDEIIAWYKYLNRQSISSLDIINGQMKAYTQWCINNHLVKDSHNHFTEISRDEFADCINKVRQEKTMLSYSDLNKLLNDIPNVCDAFLILALFEGICGTNFCEIMNLKYRDFDSDNNTVKLCTGREIHVSSQLMKLAKEASREMVYYSFGKNLEISFVEADDTIFKSFPNVIDSVSEKQKSRRVAGRFKRIMSYVGLDWYKTNDIVTSGKIALITRRCKQLGINGHAYLFSSHLGEINQQFGCSITRSTFDKQFGKFLPQ